jgi:acetyl-CoA carboxylase alpha subunit
MKSYLVKTLKSLAELSEEELVRDRYERFRKIGVFTEEATINPGTSD